MRVFEKRDKLLRDLVAQLACNDPNTDISRNVQLAKNMIATDQSPSTDEKAVAARIEGLMEKFSIIGHVERSLTLKRSFDKLFAEPAGDSKSGPSSHQLVLYDSVRLLVELANVSAQEPDYVVSQESLPKEPDLTWSDIVAEEPLEGDHWDLQSSGYQSSVGED